MATSAGDFRTDEIESFLTILNNNNEIDTRNFIVHSLNRHGIGCMMSRMMVMAGIYCAIKHGVEEGRDIFEALSDLSKLCCTGMQDHIMAVFNALFPRAQEISRFVNVETSTFNRLFWDEKEKRYKDITISTAPNTLSEAITYIFQQINKIPNEEDKNLVMGNIFICENNTSGSLFIFINKKLLGKARKFVIELDVDLDLLLENNIANAWRTTIRPSMSEYGKVYLYILAILYDKTNRNIKVKDDNARSKSSKCMNLSVYNNVFVKISNQSDKISAIANDYFNATGTSRTINTPVKYPSVFKVDSHDYGTVLLQKDNQFIVHKINDEYYVVGNVSDDFVQLNSLHQLIYNTHYITDQCVSTKGICYGLDKWINIFCSIYKGSRGEGEICGVSGNPLITRLSSFDESSNVSDVVKTYNDLYNNVKTCCRTAGGKLKTMFNICRDATKARCQQSLIERSGSTAESMLRSIRDKLKKDPSSSTNDESIRNKLARKIKNVFRK